MSDEKKSNESSPSTQHTVAAVSTNRKPLIIAISVAGVLAFGLVVSVIALVAVSAAHRSTTRTNSMTSQGGTPSQRFERPNESSGMGEGRQGGMMGGDSSTRVSGVVTAIDGDTVTVAGNGKTVTVKKTDSTTVRGTSTSLAVNDSVTVSGTTATDGTFDAKTIVIRNITSN